MIEIKDLLERFSGLLKNSEGKKVFIQETIKEFTGISINSEDIKIKNGILFLNIKSIYKNEIFFKKDKIFSKLKETLGKKAPSDFR